MSDPLDNPDDFPTPQIPPDPSEINRYLGNAADLQTTILAGYTDEIDSVLRGGQDCAIEFITPIFEEIDRILAESTMEAHVQAGKLIRKVDSHMMEAHIGINQLRAGALPGTPPEETYGEGNTLEAFPTVNSTVGQSTEGVSEWQSRKKKDSRPTAEQQRPQNSFSPQSNVSVSAEASTLQSSESSGIGSPRLTPQPSVLDSMNPPLPTYHPRGNSAGVYTTATGETCDLATSTTDDCQMRDIASDDGGSGVGDVYDGAAGDGGSGVTVVKTEGNTVVNVSCPPPHIHVHVQPCDTAGQAELNQTFISTLESISNVVNNISNVDTTTISYDQRSYSDDDTTTNYYSEKAKEKIDGDGDGFVGTNEPQEVIIEPLGDAILPRYKFAMPLGADLSKGFMCKLLLAFRADCIALGKELTSIAENAVKSGSIAVKLLLDLFKTNYLANVSEEVEANINVGNFVTSQPYLAKTLQWLNEKSNTIGKPISTEIQYLRATYNWFEGVANSEFSHTFAFKWDFDLGKSYVRGTNVAFGAMLPVVGGDQGTWNWADTRQSMKKAGRNTQHQISWKNFCAPCLKTIEFLLSHWDLQYIPSSGEVMAAYLRGGMNNEALSCYQDLLNIEPETMLPVLSSQRERPTSHELIFAHRRGLISDQKFADAMRGNGWLKPDEINVSYAMTDFVPNVGDIIRFMMRDIDDRGVVDTYGYNLEFEDKYKDRLKQWAKSQGVSDNTMLAFWQAHWDVPSNTQMYEMLHRLDEANPYLDKERLTVSKEDVERVLAINDMLPHWRGRMIEISYAPLTRVDAQRGYMIGVIDSDRLYWSFRERGYADLNARTLVAFTKRRRTEYLIKSYECRSYVRGALTQAQLRVRLETYKVTDAEFDELIPRLNLSITSRRRGVAWPQFGNDI